MNYVKRGFSEAESLALSAPTAIPQQPLKWTISYRAIAPIAMVCDALIIFAMSLLCGAAYHLEILGYPGDLTQFCGSAAVVAALFISLGKSHHLYTLPELLNFKSQTRQVAILWISVFLFLTAAAFIMKIGGTFSRGATLSFAVSGLSLLLVARLVWRMLLADGLAVRRFSGRKIALISEQDSAADSTLVEALARHGLELAAHFLLPAGRTSDPRRKAVIARAVASIRGSNIEEIVVSAELNDWTMLNGLLTELRALPLPVNLVPFGPMSELFKLSSHTIGDTVTIELQHRPRTLLERAVKRTIDILTAGIGLLLLLPLLLITAIAVKLDSPGPIIFQQRRRGFNGRLFQIYKFRTMTVMEDGDLIVPATPNDIRVTRVGNWLRRTSIDELPQLLNVLQGNMSIVGPRPHAMAHDNEFDKTVANYAYRHHVKPGLTGWAQVNGNRGELQSLVDIERRIELDFWYIDNWSVAVDFKIIFMTMFEVIRGRNAY